MKSKKCCVCGGPIKAGRCIYCGMPYRKERTLDEIGRSYSSDKKKSVQDSQRNGKSAQTGTSREKKESVHQDVSAELRKQAEQRKIAVQQQAAKIEDMLKRKQELQKRTRENKSFSYSGKRKKSSGGILSFIIALAIIIGLGSGIIGKIQQEIGDYSFGFGESSQEYDPQEEREQFLEELNEDLLLIQSESSIPQEGETLQLSLKAGNYEAGREIPAGTYCVTPAQEESMSLNVFTEAASIFAAVEEDTSFSTVSVDKIEELVLEEGSKVRVEGVGSLVFSTENAQTDTQAEAVANPLTQSLMLKGTVSVGADLESGTYDLVSKEGYGIISIKNQETYESYYVSSDSYTTSDTFRNIHLKEGDTITVDSGEGLVLVPSAEIYP